MFRAALAVLALAVMILAGCQAPATNGVEISHVHGLAYDPTQQAVFVATHHGVAKGVKAGDAWAWSYVGTERFDYMGFTQDAVQPGTFYSSGHPDDPRAFGGVHLGLRRSTDGGLTWEQRSLKGEVDFHALTALHGGEGWLAGHWQGKTKISRDAGLTWTDHTAPPAQVFALASTDHQFFAGTSSGLWTTRDVQDFEGWSIMAGPSTGTVSSVAVSEDRQTLLAATGDGRTGSTYRSVDGGANWEQLTPAVLREAAAPVIFAVDPSDSAHLFASTAGAAILESRDRGANWESIRAA